MNTLRLPEEWKGRAVSTLDILLWMREKFRTGELTPQQLTRTVDIRLFSAFVDGMSFCSSGQGERDSGLADFYPWLRDIKNEFPSPGGWWLYFLLQAGTEFGGIMLFLDRVAEFVESRQIEDMPYHEAISRKP